MSIESNKSIFSKSSEYKLSPQEKSISRGSWVQGAILVLVFIMTVFLLIMAILYILQYQKVFKRMEDEDLRPRDNQSSKK